MSEKNRIGMYFVLAALASASFTSAAVFYPSDASINSNINDYAVIGYANTTDYNVGTNGTSPTVTLGNGGVVNYEQIENSSVFNQTLGTTNFQVFANDNSTANISGGSVGYFVATTNTATANITGGTIGEYVSASSTSKVIISGGSFPKLLGTTIPFYDGTIGSFTFHGLDLTYTDAGPFSTGEDYTLTGHLADGTNLTGDTVRVYTGATMFTITNVPEPTCAASICLTTFALAIRRRSQRSK